MSPLTNADIRGTVREREQRPLVLDRAEADSLADRARALGDGTRLQLADLLSQRPEIAVGKLIELTQAERNEKSPSATSHHLSILRKAGLVSRRRRKKQMFYALTDEGRTMLAAVRGADR